MIGYTHNDIKPANIMIDKIDKSDSKVTLIDFGFATRFLSKHKEHLAREQTQTFKGNISFSSLNQMDFWSTSRRDDIISLGYMMVVILNGF